MESNLNKIMYIELTTNDINLSLFSTFDRHQDVKKCWRKEDCEWILKDISFTEHWGTKEYRYLVTCLQNTISTGGAVFGAFEENRLVGFASVENEYFGSKNEYLQLSSIHITNGSRG
ncbi:MAG: GNAT family N-acetyltransferase, partial [Clostridiales bacterium]|nr:GNAT family N-acetyltransferase [Clostridiales bacterium]